MKETNRTLNFKILLAFTDAYQTLEEKGKISKEQMMEILNILDTMEECSPQSILQDLKAHFPASSSPDPEENTESTGASSYRNLSPEPPAGHDTPLEEPHLEAGSP